MRSRVQIKKEMTSRFMANQILANAYSFDSSKSFEEEFSLLSVENILFDIISLVHFVLEKLFNQHSKEVSYEIENKVATRLPWYRSASLAYQYGFDLIKDTEFFMNDNATEDQIEESKIIKYCAVAEAENEVRIIIKIAGENGGNLAPISNEQKEPFIFYWEEIKPAGMPITIINYEPDLLYLNIDIYRDPLVLDENGISIKNGNLPVEDSITEFLKELPFDGELTIQNFVDKLQQSEGVKIANVISLESSWINEDTNTYGIPEVINVRKIPESGYFKVVNFENIRYVVQN